VDEGISQTSILVGVFPSRKQEAPMPEPIDRRRRSTRARLGQSLAAITAFCCLAATTSTASEMLAKAAASLTANGMARHVKVLADDTFEGREAGKRGGRAAAAYIVEQIEGLGFEPAGDSGTYYQSFGANMRNILAILPGRDPELAREMVIVGAHYDHVGYGNSRNSYGPYGRVHNGADDNASGVAAVIEIMAALQQLPEQPKRSILVGFWDGEEVKLLGSQHFVRVRPDCLADKTPVFCLNLDMVGRLRNRRLVVFGARTSPGLRSLLVGLNNAPGAPAFELAFDWDVTEESDHYSFITNSIPTVMLHTDLHDQYHRPSDDVELIDHDGIRDVAALTLAVAVTVANAEATPTFRPESRTESTATQRRLEEATPPGGSPRGRWGIVSRADPCEPAHPIVIAVAKDSPAAKAGIRQGDRLMGVNGESFHDQSEVVARLREIESGFQLTIDRKGIVTTVTLEPATD
jgi:hypothetical protein